MHEVESIFALPELVKMVCGRTAVAFDEDDYLATIKLTVNAEQKKRIIVERWRASLNPFLDTVLNKAHDSSQSIDDFIATVPDLLDYSTWEFAPEKLLTDERNHVEKILTSGTLEDILQLIPGKQMLPQAAKCTGLTVDTYVNLIVTSLQSSAKGDQSFRNSLEAALAAYLPTRHRAVRSTVNPYL